MCFVLLILSRYRSILYLAQLYIVGLYTLRELRDVQLCNIIILIIIIYKQNLFLTILVWLFPSIFNILSKYLNYSTSLSVRFLILLFN